MIHIRIAGPKDHNSIWQIIQEVISRGDTYVFDPGSSKEEMLDYWCAPEKHCYVAERDDKIVGTFIIQDNLPGLASHVANAGYMTSPPEIGKGIGRSMCEYSIVEAKRLGYRAMQFNMVVKTNHRAIQLWQKQGFKIIGEIPEAFNHPTLGYVDACIMWRKL